MLKRSLRLAMLVAAAACIGPFAPAAGAKGPEPPAPAPSEARMMKDLTYLASDELEGRASGSKGCEEAARYLAAALEAAGLEPAGDEQPDGSRSYFQSFTFTAGIKVRPGTKLAIKTPIKTRVLEVETDFNPLGFSSTGKVEAGVVFCGYGITATDPAYDDYAGMDVKGKVVLVIDGLPGSHDDKERKQKLIRFGQIRYKAMNARQHGAKALVVVAHEQGKGPDDPALVTVKGNTIKGDAGVIVVDLKRSAGEALFAAGDAEGGSLGKTQAAIDETSAPHSRELPLAKIALEIDLEKEMRKTQNVVAVLPGADPKLRDEAIVVGAHYDHLGHGEVGGSLSAEPGIHHGADDNASGCSSIVEVARLLATGPRPRRSVIFGLWSGEEMGLLGSGYFVKHPTVPIGQIVTNLNLDMVGRMRKDRLTVGGFGTAKEWSKVVEGAADGLGLKLKTEDDGFGPSDHSSFYGRKIPVLFLFTGAHEDYHKPSDTADKIDRDGLVKATALTERLVRGIDAADTRPTYARTTGNPHAGGQTLRGPSVWLGTIPDYADTEEPGVRIQGVRGGSPAEASGMQSGDRVVRFDGKEVLDIHDYTYALFAKKPGDKVDIVVKRDGKRVTLHAILGRRGGKLPKGHPTVPGDAKGKPAPPLHPKPGPPHHPKAPDGGSGHPGAKKGTTRRPASP